MKRFYIIIVAIFSLSFIACAGALAQSSEELASQFYNKVAEVLEAHRENPADCVKEIEGIINAHKGTLDEIRSAMESQMRKSKSLAQQSAKEEQDTDYLNQSDLSEAVHRFNEALSSFSMDSPKETTQIEKLLQQ
jgi:hypothetical protein